MVILRGNLVAIMDKLTTREIEQRIDEYSQRSRTLEDIISEIKDANAKAALKTHIASYRATILELRKELSRRNKRV